jgi:hypothetical protein
MELTYLLLAYTYNLTIIGGAIYLARNKHPFFALLVLFLTTSLHFKTP